MILDIVITLVKIWFILILVLTMAATLMWSERKQSAVMQDRIGANRANIFGFKALGFINIMADAVKMIVKEDWVPPKAHKTLHTLAPIASFFPVLIVFAVIPFGNVLNMGGKAIPLQILNINMGILFVFAFASLTVYGLILAGWSSNNKFSMLGGIRGCSQMISYELIVGLALIGIFMVFGTLKLDEIVREQNTLLFGFLPKWGIVVQPLGFLLFLPAALAETKRVPFDLPEGESEIIGFNTEYSSMKFGMFFMGEFMEVTLAAALLTTLFFGGYNIPYLYNGDPVMGFLFPWGGTWILPQIMVVILQFCSFMIKLTFFCWLQQLVRWTLPRFRYDQLMSLSWKELLPLTLVNIMLTGIVMIIVG
jgi:NADH-quinone oxidoreductase subunit H